MIFFSPRRSLALPRLLDPVLIGCILLAGCLEVRLARTAITTNQVTIEDATPLPAQAGLILHPDGAGWTVRVTQPISKRALIQRDESWTYRSTTWNPVSLIAGMFRCEGAILGSLITPGKADIPDKVMRQENAPFWGCLSWTGVTPTGDVTISEREEVVVQTSQEERPATTAHVEVVLMSGSRPALTYSLDENGRARVRLSHLAIAANRQGTRLAKTGTAEVEIKAEDGDKQVARWTFPVTGAQLTQSLQDTLDHLDPERWPRPLRVAIGAPPPLSPAESGLIETGLAQVFRRHQIQVLPSTSGRTTVQAEQLHQAGGLVADGSMTSIAHWTAPTALLFIDRQTSSHRQVLSLQVVSVESGLVLGQVTAEGHRQDFQGLLEEVLGKLEAQLPMTETHSPEASR